MSRAHTKPPSGTGGSRDESSSRPRADPFAGRVNYPSLEEAFLENVDQSICSHTSSLNLSIGARAALEEHLRHVARFGLDESHVDEENSNNGIPILQNPRDPLDEHWERLIGTSSNAPGTPNSSFFRNTSGHTSEGNYSRFDESGEAAEVLTDLSSDYFNSSRVNLLRTPEKNLLRRGEVTRRDDDFIDASFVSETEQFAGRHILQDNLPGDTSFSALSAADTSRISALDVSHISADGSDRRSPDTSLLVQNHRTTIEDNEILMRLLTHSPTATIQHSSAQCDLRSEWSPTSRSSPRRENANHKHLPPNSENSSGGGGASIPTKKGSSLNKGNLVDDLNLNMDILGLSPISARTGTLTRRFITTSPGLLLAATTYSTTKNGLPSAQLVSLLESPPSAAVPWEDHVEIENNELQIVYERTHDSDISTLQNQSSSARNSSLTSSRSRSVSFHPSNDTNSNSTQSPLGVDDSDDRRRYRTVVPSRVFLQDPNEFPEQYDSFSCPLIPVREHPLPAATVDRSSQSAPT